MAAEGYTRLFVPGPAQVCVGLGTANLGLYLGTTAGGVNGRFIFHTGNVQGDPAGVDGMPMDMRLSGIGIIASGNFQILDPGVMQLLEMRYFNLGLASPASAPGVVPANSIGSLMLTEGLSFPVWINSPYQNKTQYSAFPAGLHILWCIATDITKDYSTKEQSVNITFTGITNMNNSTLAGTCYDTNMSGFVGPD